MSKASDLLRSLAGSVGIGTPTVIPSIPTVPTTGDANVDQFLSALKQTIETWAGERGDSLDSAVTWRGLIDKQFATIDLTESVPGSGNGFLPIRPREVSDLTPPPAPQNLVASGALSTIILDWDTPSYGNHAYTEIWRSGTPVIGAAERIGMAPGAVYADSVGGGHTYYYWIRFVSTADVAGPYNSTEGTVGSTSLDPGYVLDVLAGQISETELAGALASRIALIDGDASVAGSVNARVLQEASDRAAAILAEATTRAGADADLQTQISLLSAASSGDFQELLAALQEEQTARASADAAEAASRETLATQVRGTYTGTDVAQLTTGLLYNERVARSTADSSISSTVTALQSTVANNYSTLNAAITSEATTRASADTAESTARQALAARVTTAESDIDTNAAAITSEASTRATADTALGTRIDTLTATVTTNNSTLTSAIQTEQTARANADTALTSSINTLQSTVTNNNTTLTAAVQTEATTRATVDNGLLAQYTVKTDVNGYVSGFGLASTTAGATPFSNFIFKADQFAFGAPGYTTAYPFVIQATATTVNGVAVPAGVYIDAAYIKNGTLTNAKIGNAAIDSAKIADASIVNAKIADAAITSAKIRDAEITNAKIADAAITTAKIANAAIGTAQIANGSISTAKIADAQITEAKVANAAITAAKIADANITNAKIQDGSITNAKIADAQITAAKIADAQITAAKIADAQITTAKIADAQISTAKIGVAQIDTLRIAGQAVTNGAGASGSGYSQAVTLTTTDAPVVVWGTGIGRIGAGVTAYVRLYRDGLNIRSGSFTNYTTGNSSFSISLLDTDVPGVGTHTYSIGMENAGSAGPSTSVFALEYKR